MELRTQFKTKIFADGADLNSIAHLYSLPSIKGFTTNPSIMRQAGIHDYKTFAMNVLKTVKTKPISFEVIADNFKEMYRQALQIASWGDNVYVKIPVMNTKSQYAYELIHRLAQDGIQQNITAILTLDQVREVTTALAGGPSAFISVFAGRIADTGRDPLPMMAKALEIMQPCPQLELIWASPREVLNLFHADSIAWHVITMTDALLKKLSLVDKDLNQYTVETVKMFYEDAIKAGLNFNETSLSTQAVFDFAD